MANRFKAPIRVSIDTDQLRGLIERIQALDKKAGRKAMRGGLGEVTKAVLGDARDGVPKRSGTLRRALGRKVVVQRGGAKLLGIVKPRGGVWTAKPPDFVMDRRQKTLKNGKTLFFVKKYQGVVGGAIVNPARYAHLVEFGRVSVRLKKKKVLSTGPGGTIFGTVTRAVPARPFMRPAWAKNEPQTVAKLHKWLAAAVWEHWEKSRRAAPRAKRKR